MKSGLDKKVKSIAESFEDIFMAVTYAEAADLKDLWSVFNYEVDLACPDECQYGDNELRCHES